MEASKRDRVIVATFPIGGYNTMFFIEIILILEELGFCHHVLIIDSAKIKSV